jgi:hypothetical protein
VISKFSLGVEEAAYKITLEVPSPIGEALPAIATD